MSRQQHPDPARPHLPLNAAHSSSDRRRSDTSPLHQPFNDPSKINFQPTPIGHHRRGELLSRPTAVEKDHEAIHAPSRTAVGEQYVSAEPSLTMPGTRSIACRSVRSTVRCLPLQHTARLGLRDSSIRPRAEPSFAAALLAAIPALSEPDRPRSLGGERSVTAPRATT